MDIRAGGEGEKNYKMLFSWDDSHCDQQCTALWLPIPSATPNWPCQQPWMGKEFVRSASLNAQLLAKGVCGGGHCLQLCTHW